MKRRILSLLLLSAGILIASHQLVKKEATLSRQAALKASFEEAVQAKREEEAALLAALDDLHQEVKDYFYYNQLSKVEQTGYLRLLHSLRQFDPDAYLNNHDGFAQGRIFLALAYDNPEFYWLSETKYDINYMDIAYPKDAKAVYQQLQAIGDEVISKMPEGSDYEKVKYIYEYIIHNTAYNLAALENEDLAWANQSIRSVFLEKTSICNGYSLAFHFLCQKAGLKSLYVAGDIKGENLPHAWNLVEIDGTFYAVDTTWGDPTFSVAIGEAEGLMAIDYAYLAMPREIFEKSHSPWESFYGLDDATFDYPEIGGDRFNYLTSQGGYLEGYQPDQVGQALVHQFEAGNLASIQIKNSQEFETFLADLEAGRATYLHAYLQHFPDYKGYEYWSNPSAQTVTFRLKP